MNIPQGMSATVASSTGECGGRKASPPLFNTKDYSRNKGRRTFTAGLITQENIYINAGNILTAATNKWRSNRSEISKIRIRGGVFGTIV